MKRFKVIIFISMFALIFAGCASQGNDASGPITMGTHPSGSLINTIGISIASVAAENDVVINVSPYGGPSQWLPEMRDGLLQLGIESSHGTKWAYSGEHTYSEPNDFLRIVSAGVYPVFNGLLVRDNSGIETIADLKGKRVPTGFGSQIASHISTFAMLATEGVTEQDVQSVPVTSITDGIELFKDGAIDVILLPTSSPDVQELDASAGVRYLPMSDSPEAVKTLQEFVPGNSVLPARGGTPALDVETKLVAMAFMLLAHKDVADETITSMLSSYWDNVNQLHEKHPAMRGWVNDRQVPADPVLITAPYHDAAIAFYKEKGIWKAEHDARQAELLAN